MDSKPRQLDAESCNLLCNFAELVARELDRGSQPAPDTSRLNPKDLMGIMLVDVSAPKWSILYTSALWQRITRELHAMYVSYDSGQQSCQVVKLVMPDSKNAFAQPDIHLCMSVSLMHSPATTCYSNGNGKAPKQHITGHNT